jgi:glutathione S-transferase
MLKLYGFPISDYTNKVRLALEEKGIPHELDLTIQPSQEDSFRQRSPLGKVPYLETEHGIIVESTIICEYLEERFHEKPLYPKDPIARAKVRTLTAVLELNLELVARRLFPEMLFGRKVSEEVKQEVTAGLDKGVRALTQLASFSPFIAGPELTIADCAAFFHLPYVSMASKAVLGHDVLASIHRLPDYYKHMLERPTVKKIDGERQAMFDTLMAARKRT